MTTVTVAHERLLTPAEVAVMFRVDPKTVTRWAKAGCPQSEPPVDTAATTKPKSAVFWPTPPRDQYGPPSACLRERRASVIPSALPEGQPDGNATQATRAR